MSDSRMSRRAFVAVAAAACFVFAAYAGCFLYFFVDDEAIPLVYARNLLRGRGLVYTVLEGRVEGYSDFLHVLWSALLLEITRSLGYSRLAPLIAGKAISFCGGLGIIVVTARALRRLDVGVPAMVGALGFLALAGPLAVWSGSSLETTVFALTATALAITVLNDDLPAAVVLGSLAVLERIDGPIYVGAAIIGALAADPRRWRRLMTIAGLVAMVAAAFHGWRLVYFGSVLSAPLEAKILIRLTGAGHAIVKSPDEAYLTRLLAVYGWIAAPVLVVAAVAVWRSPTGRAAVVILLLLGIYAEVVDDWMFGWRFAVALAPFAAIVLALAVDRLPRPAARAAAAGLCLWSAVAARSFLHQFGEAEHKPIFWAQPRGGQAVWLGRYGDVVAASRRFMHAGDHIAFNQAGLLPYMLDVENLDDLGICSRFVARLPTTDVYFTGVGRYSPLTNQPVLRAAHAYLLYHNVKFVVAPADLLSKANGGIPEFLLDGAFVRVPADETRESAIYRRTDKPMDRFARDPAAFTENLAHTSRIVGASIDGAPLPSASLGPQLPFLREQTATIQFTGSTRIEVTFAQHDEDISALYIGNVRSQVPGTITLALVTESGGEALRRDVVIGPDNRLVLESFPLGTRARALSLAIQAPGRDRLTLSDVRLEGQSAALRDYVRRRLRFPAPGW